MQGLIEGKHYAEANLHSVETTMALLCLAYVAKMSVEHHVSAPIGGRWERHHEHGAGCPVGAALGIRTILQQRGGMAGEETGVGIAAEEVAKVEASIYCHRIEK
jgi:hypothetical protein